MVKTVPKPHWLHVVAAMGDDHPTNALRREKIWEPGLTVLIRCLVEGVGFRDLEFGVLGFVGLGCVRFMVLLGCFKILLLGC